MKICKYFRIYLIVYFVYCCYKLPSTYNERYLYNFYYNCIFLILQIIVFFVINYLIKVLKEDKNDNNT
jgi:hypothetical protein